MPFCPKCGEPVRGSKCRRCDVEGVAPTTDAGGIDPATDKTYGHVSTGFKTRETMPGVKEMMGLEDVEGLEISQKKVYQKCFGCGREITGQGMKMEGKYWHPQCYDNKTQCSVCGKPIFGEVVQTKNKTYCPDCWKCTECHRQLDDDAVFIGGNPFCQKCNEEKKKKKTAAREQQNSRAADARGAANRARADAHEKQVRDFRKEQKCGKCGKMMIDTGVVAGGSVFHEECFVCGLCEDAFPDMRYHMREGLPYHADCIKKKFAAQCSVCKKPILTGRIYEMDGKKMHEACFKCSECGNPLQGGYVEKGTRTLCISCADAESTPTKHVTGKATPAGQTRGGVRVDPITGKVMKL